MKDAKEQLRQQAAVKDSVNIGKLEQALAQRNEQESGTDDMFDIDEARKVLRKSWLGQEITEVEIHKFQCESCGSEYKGNPTKCKNCGSTKLEDKGVFDYERTWAKVTENPKMNREGFSSLWGTIQPFLTKTTQVSYLREQTIIKLSKSTIRDVINEIRAKHDDYYIDDRQTGSQIVTEALTIIVAAINKSREGRSMVSRERTIVEKISRALGSEEDDDSSMFGLNVGI